MGKRVFLIDDARIYNRAHSAAEIAAMYAGEKGHIGDIPPGGILRCFV